MPQMATEEARLILRNATRADVPGIVALSATTYGEHFAYLPEMVGGQLAQFPEGQFVAEYDGQIVGYCATFRIDEAAAMSQHGWREITGGGYASRHNPAGDWMYGMEVCVDPNRRGLRIGRRLYDRRKRLCEQLGLKGIVFGGRLPGLSRRIKQFGGATEYVNAVLAGKVRDLALSFQLRNGFELVGVLPAYLPSDHESLGYAAHLVWRNPRFSDHPVISKQQLSGDLPDRVRVATVQYQQRRISSFEEFATQVEYFVDIAADYRSDFVVFPELFTLQLLSIENKPLSPSDSIRTLTRYTDQLSDLLCKLAVSYNINIIGGSHPTQMADGDIHNICYVALRDGSVHEREKLHPTPNERHWWKIAGGDSAEAIATDCGPIGVMICYDSEFPEMARHLVDQGAMILFVPYCTDVRQGHLRVRYSCQARAIENQVYVVTSGNVGNLPGVNNFDIQYAQSCIITPCDFPFAPEGIAADTTPNAEQVAFADLRLDDLLQARASGTVQNLRDRRHDLYQTTWKRRA
ncbi:MAG: carbon-nitrogen hydrolase family protein [Aquimonas sp.]|nr:carbon-nitrogen hydrolase family protein [Aquimonas sp.]